MAIQKFDRATCGTLRTDVLQALEAVAKKHGVAFDFGRGSFTPVNFTFKVTASVKAAGVTLTPEVADYATFGVLSGLPKDSFGKTFKTHTGATFEIVGFRRRAHKRPVLAKNLTDGKNYVFSVASVVTLLGPSKAA